MVPLEDRRKQPQRKNCSFYWKFIPCLGQMYKTYISFWKQLWQLNLNFKVIKQNVTNPSLVSTTHHYFSDKFYIKINVTGLMYRLYLTSRGPGPKDEQVLWKSWNTLRRVTVSSRTMIKVPFPFNPPLNQRPLLIFLRKIPVESSYLMISGIQVLLPRGINLFYLSFSVAEVYLPTHFIECHITFMLIK